MKIKGQLTWKDYHQANLLNLKPTRTVFTVLLLGVVIYGVFFILGARYEMTREITIYMLPVILVVAGIFALLFFVVFPMRIKRIFSQQKELSAPIEYEPKEETIVISNAYGYSERPWSEFHKWKENQHLFILYHSDAMMNIIPKRFLTDPDQENFIRNRLEENLSTTPKKKKMVRILIILFFLISVICVVFYQLRAMQ